MAQFERAALLSVIIKFPESAESKHRVYKSWKLAQILCDLFFVISTLALMDDFCSGTETSEL